MLSDKSIRERQSKTTRSGGASQNVKLFSLWPMGEEARKLQEHTLQVAETQGGDRADDHP